MHSHGVIEHNILFGKLQQHRIIEEFADAHIFTEALPTAGFDHEFPGQVRSRLWLQGADDNALVQRITRHNLPMVEDRQRKGLSLGVSPKISLKAKRVDGWDKSFDGVQGSLGWVHPESHDPCAWPGRYKLQRRNLQGPGPLQSSKAPSDEE